MRGITEPEWLEQALLQDDPAAVITGAACDGKSELCERTLTLFTRILGAEAGNLAVKALAPAECISAAGLLHGF